MEDWYEVIQIDSEDRFLHFRSELPKTDAPKWWLYRGLSRTSYGLETSLERRLVEAGWTLERDAQEKEVQLLKDFKRRTHHYISHLPEDGDIIGWLALMQHYGAPTRLLDWTYSFYIAAYFALIYSSPKEKCAVWAIYRNAFVLKTQHEAAYAAYDQASTRTLGERSEIDRQDGDNISDGINAMLWHVMKDPMPGVWAINSFRLNDRLSVQQGVFMCPLDVRKPFAANLQAGIRGWKSTSDETSRPCVVKFEISSDQRLKRKLLTLLHEMNISHTSLFPGLAGFAQSLTHKLWADSILRVPVPDHVAGAPPLGN